MRISDWSSDVCSSDLSTWRGTGRSDQSMSIAARSRLQAVAATGPCREPPLMETAAPWLAVVTRLSRYCILTGARFAPEGAARPRPPAACPSWSTKEHGMKTRTLDNVAGEAVALAHPPP